MRMIRLFPKELCITGIKYTLAAMDIIIMQGTLIADIFLYTNETIH